MTRMLTQTIVVGLTLGLIITPRPALAAPPALKDFFRNPEKVSFAVSPDGKYLSWVASYENRRNVFVRPLAGGAETRVSSETARDISGYFWKGARILYLKDFGGDENFHVVSVDLAGKDLKDLTPGEKLRAEIVDVLQDDDQYVLISHNRRDPRVADVYRVDVRTGKESLVAQNPGNITGWMTDHAGHLRVAMTTDGVDSSLLYREKERDPFKPILTTNFKENVSPLFFTFDNTRLYVSSNRGRDKAAIFEFDPATAKEGKLIYEHPEVDVTDMAYSRKRKVLLFVTYTTWKIQRHFLDPEAKAMLEKVQAQLPNYEVSLGPSNKAEDKYIVSTASDRTRGSCYLLNKATGKLTFLGEVSPWLKEQDLSEMKPITYVSRDGLTIHGYLTLPKGKAAKGLPVVVNPHGGPWYRDTWEFNPEVQFLASRGYAVFQMNFRGSTGYGRKFWEASFKQWGGTMQNDITDGVNWLVEQGIADPKRIAIYGCSYGGYATLAGVTLTPDLYAAAVDYVGVSNIFTFMKAIPPYWKPFLEMMYEMIGNPEKDKARLEATSPAFLADRIKAPLLIAQGANDPRVNKDESDQMVALLKKRGIEVEYMVKENEGHGFQNEENNIAFYEAMERFLGKHMNP